MRHDEIRDILDEVTNRTLSLEGAEARLVDLIRSAPFDDLQFAKIDHHRMIRQGRPEAIFGAGKTPDQVAAIAERLVAAGTTLLVTRATGAMFEAVQRLVPDATFHPAAGLIVRRASTSTTGHGIIAVAAAGTSDFPVAEEARLSAEALGNTVDAIYDIGVAGLPRLLAARPRLDRARVVIAVAGMEGALPSVIGGLVRVPVIAVPTSVGYGAHLGGIAALLGMLNSCASGVTVVNIDNGFGAATCASIINHLD